MHAQQQQPKIRIKMKLKSLIFAHTHIQSRHYLYISLYSCIRYIILYTHTEQIYTMRCFVCFKIRNWEIKIWLSIYIYGRKPLYIHPHTYVIYHHITILWEREKLHDLIALFLSILYYFFILNYNIDFQNVSMWLRIHI